MTETAEPALWQVVLYLTGIVVVYYAGTRGIVVATRRFQGRWWRRALVSLTLAILFAPSLAVVGHGGIIPAPAWVVGIEYADAGIWTGVMRWSVAPMLAVWGILFVLSSLGAVLSKNKNKKVDTHGKET